jgi:ribose transport system permease protein
VSSEQTTVSTPAADWERGWRSYLPQDLGSWGPVFAFVLVFVVFGIWKTDVFLTQQNLFTILNDNADLAIVSFGLTVVLLTGEFDLSLAGVISFTGFLSAGLIANQGLPTPASVVVVLLVGALIGLVNGVLVVYFQIHALIATLAVASILDGLTFLYSGGAVLYTGIPNGFIQIGRAGLGNLDAPAFYMVVIGVVLWAMLRYTPAGRYMHAIGGNRDASRLSGIRVSRHVIAAFMISAVCASVCGIVEVARNGSAQPTAGASFLLPAFAAAFLGAATLRRGEFHIIGTAIGVYLIAVATSGLFILGAPFYSQEFLTGGLLILATAGSRFLGRRREETRVRAQMRRRRSGGASLPRPDDPSSLPATGGDG